MALRLTHAAFKGVVYTKMERKSFLTEKEKDLQKNKTIYKKLLVLECLVLTLVRYYLLFRREKWSHTFLIIHLNRYRYKKKHAECTITL